MKKKVGLYLPEDIMDKVKYDADKENRSINQQVAYILKKYYESKKL